MQIVTRLKEVGKDTTQAKAGREKVGLYPISVRVFDEGDFTISEDGGITISGTALAEIESVSGLLKQDVERFEGPNGTEPAGEGNGEGCATPVREKIGVEHLIKLLNNADNLDARQSTQDKPWVVGGTGRGKAIAKVKEQNEQLQKNLLVMEYVMELSRDGTRHEWWGADPIRKKELVEEIYNSDEFVEWTRSR